MLNNNQVDNNNIYIQSSDELNEACNKFLIDTRADLNLIKLKAVSNFVPINVKYIKLHSTRNLNYIRNNLRLINELISKIL